MRTARADAGFRSGRMGKAQQFADVARDALALADEAAAVADAFVRLAVRRDG